MFRYLAGLLVVCSSALAMIGCSQKSTITEEKKVSTPGGTATEKTTTEIKKTGELKDGEKTTPTP